MTLSRDSIVEHLADEWRSSGLGPNDVVLLHSSVRRTIRRSAATYGTPPSAQELLESFLRALAPAGTLLLPLFNFDFTRGVGFDVRITPSKMGVLSEAGRMYPYAVRTGHPIYSFAAIGHHAPRFERLMNFSGYGADSPFAILRDLDGKIAVLDLPDQDSMTFYHHVEEMENVLYRYHKTFSGPYVDWDGNDQERTFGLFVRDLSTGVVTDVNAMGEHLWELGLYQGSRAGHESGLRVISARDLYNATAEVIRSGRALGLLYSLENT